MLLRSAALLLSTMAALPLLSSPTYAVDAACVGAVNNTIAKLTNCVTLEGVRAHQAALQAIADANFGIRTSGTPGYDASVDYVVATLEAAGYTPVVQPFTFLTFIELQPSLLEQVAPGAVVYTPGVDFAVMTQSDPGELTAAVTTVDLQLGLGNASTSGCEAADFAGFPAGNVALIQRGTCNFEQKAGTPPRRVPSVSSSSTRATRPTAPG